MLLLFSSGYLVYRMLAVTRLTDAFVAWALNRSQGRLSTLLLYIIATAAFISAFMPNAIAALTLLPVLKVIDEDFRAQGGGPALTTALTVSAIYGAGIGGMASLIGSPANLILLAALDLYQVPGREALNFFNWFLWSLPLTVLFVLAAWGVVAGLGLPAKARSIRACVEGLCEIKPLTHAQRSGGLVFAFFLGYWILEAVLAETWPGFAALRPAAALGFGGLFCFFLFVRPPRLPRDPSRAPLIAPLDVLRGWPKRGLVFLGLLVCVVAAVRAFDLDRAAADLVRSALGPGLPWGAVFVALVLAVIFLTEVLSNTAVVAAFFSIAFFLAQARAVDPLPIMIAVSIASTCAFMTPIATPCNALAFGEMKGTSLWRMVALGAVLNLIGGLLLSFWLIWAVPLVYG
ncbi:MAG: anion permease [Desulfovibrionaceae bacterium]|nr:anion permease [Desulfovibrionaceae bacterium]